MCLQREMGEEYLPRCVFGDIGFFYFHCNIFAKTAISSQPYGRRSAVAKLVNDLVSTAVLCVDHQDGQDVDPHDRSDGPLLHRPFGQSQIRQEIPIA